MLVTCVAEVVCLLLDSIVSYHQGTNYIASYVAMVTQQLTGTIN